MKYSMIVANTDSLVYAHKTDVTSIQLYVSKWLHLETLIKINIAQTTKENF